MIFGNARVFGDAWVLGDARVSGDARIYGNARVFDDAQVYGNARVGAVAGVALGARVSTRGEVVVANAQASEVFDFTAYRTETAPRVIMGCWTGTLDEFEAMILSDRWVEADEATQNRCRPELVALIAFVRARVATWG